MNPYTLNPTKREKIIIDAKADIADREAKINAGGLTRQECNILRSQINNRRSLINRITEVNNFHNHKTISEMKEVTSLEEAKAHFDDSAETVLGTKEGTENKELNSLEEAEAYFGTGE